MRDFSLEEMVKVFLLALHTEEWESKERDHSNHSSVNAIRHISFEPLMNTMYYDYKGVKKLNIYKKRMIEKYLEQYSWEQVIAGEQPPYPHLGHRIERYPDLPDTLFVTFEFSPAAEKLIALH